MMDQRVTWRGAGAGACSGRLHVISAVLGSDEPFEKAIVDRSMAEGSRLICFASTGVQANEKEAFIFITSYRRGLGLTTTG